MTARRPLQDALTGATSGGHAGEDALAQLGERLLDAQFELRERRDRAVVLIVTGIPAAGRSEVVHALLEWLDPKLLTVYGFRACTDDERERPPLWRYWRVLPPKGRIAILHGGWYQDLLQQSLPSAARSRGRWTRAVERSAERIRRLERMLVADGVAVAKVHLHVSAATQRKRLRKLAAAKATRWRVTEEDRASARRHAEVERALERCLAATDHPLSPWHVVDGTDARLRTLDVGQRLLEAMSGPVSSAPDAGAAHAARPKPARAAPMRSQPPRPRPDDDTYHAELERLQGRLARLSRRRRFTRHAVVAVFEGMDAAGKGGAIRRVTAALDARQYRVVPVSAPTPEELARPYLWRFWVHLPARGNWTIFDRSWYGRVLVERVRGLTPERDWQRAYEEVVEFERQLVEHGVVVAKFWLAVGRAEQRTRFEARDRNPLKRHKVDPEDWVNREHWDEYQRAAREMLARTDTRDAPWCVVPADDKRSARLAVLRALGDRIEAVLEQGR